MDRAGADASFPFQFAFRAALDERIFDDPGRPSPPIALGYLLINIARTGIELEPDDRRRVEEALEQSTHRLHNSLTFTVKRRGASALWAAAESMSRAAIGQQRDSRALVASAIAVLANSDPADISAQDRDFGLCWCVKTLTFLGQTDTAVPLLGYISGAFAAAQANYSLAKSYLEEGDPARAMHMLPAPCVNTSIPPSCVDWIQLVPTIAAFEKALTRGNQ